MISKRNHIALHHKLTNQNIDSAQCLTYITNYFHRLTLEIWYTNLEQTPLNRCQQVPAPYKRLTHDENETADGLLTDRLNLTNNTHSKNPTNLTNDRRIETDQ